MSRSGHGAERLEEFIKAMQRHRFGRRAETLSEDQLLLGLEDVEQTAAATEAADESKDIAKRTVVSAERRANRGALPLHLPRIKILHDLDDKSCPCCCNLLHKIGEDRSERLDIVPAQFRVLVTCRPCYACRTCEDVVIEAAAPARLIESGLPTETTVAQVLVARSCQYGRASSDGMPEIGSPARNRQSLRAVGVGIEGFDLQPTRAEGNAGPSR